MGGRGRPDPKANCTHTQDFSTVAWYGEEYHFNTTQSKCVEKLWAEWEKNPDGRPALHQRTIRDAIGSENADFRLIHVFRQKGEMHPAWGTMIHALGDGRFYLGKPLPAKKKNRRRIPRKRRK